MFSIAALSHFKVAVSSIVMALAAFLILPRYRAIRVAEPIANIAVSAVAARRGTAVTAVPYFLDQGDAFVQRVGG
jgi:hypothetical protein